MKVTNKAIRHPGEYEKSVLDGCMLTPRED